jgi:hypothetical protein
LYGELAEDNDEVGDCSGREGDCIDLKKSAILSFAFLAIEDDGKISLEVFGGSAGHDFLKKHAS